MRAPLGLTLCMCSVVLFMGCTRAGRQAALPLDPLTAEEEQTVVQDGEEITISGQTFWSGEAHTMWVGWMLKPHNIFDRTPLFP